MSAKGLNTRFVFMSNVKDIIEREFADKTTSARTVSTKMVMELDN